MCVLNLYLNLYTMFISYQLNTFKTWGDTRVRTGDLSICSRMLYHWAISPPLWGGKKFEYINQKSTLLVTNKTSVFLVLGPNPSRTLNLWVSGHIIYHCAKTLYIRQALLKSLWCTFAYFEMRFSLKIRGHPGLNQGPLDLQSNDLPLIYTPTSIMEI